MVRGLKVLGQRGIGGGSDAPAGPIQERAGDVVNSVVRHAPKGLQLLDERTSRQMDRRTELLCGGGRD